MKIKYDGTITLSVGKSRKELHWKNEDFLWSDLLTRLSETHRTAETHAEYIAATKARQDEIKDVGGFVGGVITGGRRKAGSIAERHLLTLDADFSKGGLWDTFTMLYGCAACVYSTHKHTPENNRLRLIIPLSRAVFADEYEAIGRKVAEAVGIEDFDPTTFEPSRLMYWASTSKDGEFVFEYQDGAWLDADSVLSEYKDWRDSSQWAVSSRESNVIRREIKKADDPTEKDGVIGAFCRAYSIHEAIETFLSDHYEKCDSGEGRYTYKHGSTAGGLVTYDDKWAYSHHGTDPTSGKLSNAFDLVRAHLFGLKDENVNERTNITKYPSYLAMLDFAAADKKTAKLMSVERLESAGRDFADEDDTDWLAELQTDRKGNVLSTIDNALIILRNDPKLKGLFALNQFDLREVALRNMPWRGITPNTQFLQDSDGAGLRHYLEKYYEIKSRTVIQDAVAMICEENGFHPVKNFLKELKWDGTPRLETLLIDYLGAKDNAYIRTIIKKVLLAAIYRIYHPGHKFDYVLTLVGAQGVGKSTFVKKLGMGWYSDSFGTIQGKEAYESIQGVWLMEMGELAGLKKAEMETVKHFISKSEDRYRVAYGRRTQNFPRQCIFIGTTNNRYFLHDPTGNRRFLPVDVCEETPNKSVWDDLNVDEVSQIWAEASELYKRKETTYLGKEVEELARLEQEEHSEQDERAQGIKDYLDTLLPSDWEKMSDYQKRDFIRGNELSEKGTQPRMRVHLADIWREHFGRNAADLHKYEAKELRQIMATFDDWEPKLVRVNGKVSRGYERVNVESLKYENEKV